MRHCHIISERPCHEGLLQKYGTRSDYGLLFMDITHIADQVVMFFGGIGVLDP